MKLNNCYAGAPAIVDKKRNRAEFESEDSGGLEETHCSKQVKNGKRMIVGGGSPLFRSNSFRFSWSG
jgi:hypothetical protein